MSLAEIHLPRPLFVFSIQCLTQLSRLRVLLHFTDNKYVPGPVIGRLWKADSAPPAAAIRGKLRTYTL